MGILLNVLVFAITIGILVTIHEYGHFFVARKSGVMVERFSIGFGKRLFSWYDRHGTEFTLSAIPLGGYVKMLDERAGKVSEHQRAQAFNNKTVGVRAAIISAGPIANFLLALILFWIVAMIGSETRKTVIIDIIPNSLAAKSDIPTGYWLVEINGQSSKSIQQANQILKQINEQESHSSIELTLVPLNDSSIDDNDQIKRVIDIKNWQYDSTKELPLNSLGIMTPEPPLIIANVLDGSVAQGAGLLVNDEIIEVNGESITSGVEFTQIVRYRPNDKLFLGVLRNGELKKIQIIPTSREIETPKGKQTIGFIGVEFANNALKDEYMMITRYNPAQAILIAGQQFSRMLSAIGSFFYNAVMGNASLDDVAGPVGIAKAATNSFSVGITAYLFFLGMLSLNLGIMNLLPIPVLDGGHLIFLAIEKVKGSPVSSKIQERFYQIGALLLFCLMIIVIMSDIISF